MYKAVHENICQGLVNLQSVTHKREKPYSCYRSKDMFPSIFEPSVTFLTMERKALSAPNPHEYPLIDIGVDIARKLQSMSLLLDNS